MLYIEFRFDYKIEIVFSLSSTCGGAREHSGTLGLLTAPQMRIILIWLKSETWLPCPG